MSTRRTKSPTKHWEAWYGTEVVDAGTKRDGSPRRTLVTLILIAHTKTDAENIAQAHPHLKFVEHVSRDGATNRSTRRKKP